LLDRYDLYVTAKAITDVNVCDIYLSIPSAISTTPLRGSPFVWPIALHLSVPGALTCPLALIVTWVGSLVLLLLVWFRGQLHLGTTHSCEMILLSAKPTRYPFCWALHSILVLPAAILAIQMDLIIQHAVFSLLLLRLSYPSAISTTPSKFNVASLMHFCCT
jgi:hypothetical protein